MVFAPEICLCIFAVAVILLDLFVQKKGVLAGISVTGLLVTCIISLSLWGRDNASFANGALATDEFSIFFHTLFVLAAALVILASRDYVNKLSRFQGEFYALILLATIGMMLMASSRDLLAIYLAVELASLSLYGLVGFLKDNRSSEASLKYVLLGAMASCTMLFGMSMVFGVTGHTNVENIRDAINAMSGVTENSALLLGLVFLIAGFGFKIASVPFQMWVPDVYEGAPTPITAFLSVASKAAGFAVIMRVFIEAFGTEPLSHNWTMAFAVLAIVSMTLGNLAALSQTNVKRMLGYSSIAQAGYLLIGIAAYTTVVGTDTSGFGPTGILFFLAGYTLTNLGAFIAIIALSNKANSDQISDFAGMGKRAPVIALALTLCLASLTGLPPAVGFLGKFYLFNTAVQNDLLWLVVIGVINSVISAFYYFRVIKAMWFTETESIAEDDKVPSSWALRLALLVACFGVILFFFAPDQLLVWAEDAVRALSL